MKTKPQFLILGGYVLLYGLFKLYFDLNNPSLFFGIRLGFLESVLVLLLAAGIVLMNRPACLGVAGYFFVRGIVDVGAYASLAFVSLLSFLKKSPSNDPAGYSHGDGILWGFVMIVLVAAFYFIPVIFLIRAKK